MSGLTPAEFKKAVQDYAKKTAPKIMRNEVAVAIGMVHDKILEGTPVLSGKARANWRLSLNDPYSDQLDEVAGVTETGEPVTGAESARREQVLKSFVESPDVSKVWMANNLPYINLLDKGTSQKAPLGIVDVAVASALEVVGSKGVKISVSRAG